MFGPGHHFMDSSQDHPVDEEDYEGYGDGNIDGDTTLQPHYNQHDTTLQPYYNQHDHPSHSDDDFFTNLFQQEQEQSQAQPQQSTTAALPMLERHLPYPPPPPSGSTDQGQSAHPPEVHRRLTELTHNVS